MDIEQAKRDWELNRLKQQREDEERRAELEEDDMLYTYTKEDAMNQVPKKKKAKKYQRKRPIPPPSRKSNRPHHPKQLDKISESDLVEPPRPKRRGRPPKNPNKLKMVPVSNNTGGHSKIITLKNDVSNGSSLMLRRKPGSKTYLISSSGVNQSLSNGVKKRKRVASDNSDVDV